MNTQTTTYETGATSHAVNELILFTDNTRELAEMRDKAYKNMVTQQRAFNRSDNLSHLEVNYFHLFSRLSLYAIKRYKQEFPNYEDHKHLSHVRLSSGKPGTWTDEQLSEYVTLYLKDFSNWKQEHGYK